MNELLNYTHGMTLQAFLQDALDNQTAEKESYISWIDWEMELLRRNQGSVWGITESMRYYYEFLKAAKRIFSYEYSAEAVSELLEKVKHSTRDKIHVLFLTQEPACWPSLQSVFAAAQNDDAFKATVVYTPYFHENYTEQIDYYASYHEMGVPVVRHNEYRLDKDSPDIAFMIKPYGNTPDAYQAKNITLVIPRIVYVPYGMEITTDLIKFGFQYYLHYKAWRHCAYGEIVKQYGTEYGYRNGENIAVWGHPKADHYLDLEKNRENIPEDWKEKIAGRKTILWTPHHLIDLADSGTGTWLIWGNKILELAIKNPEVCFIMRPHPLMMGALVNSGSMTQKQADHLMERIENAENIIWDTHAGYHTAFDAADAIITDGTTFSVEFLYTKKPILLTPRNMEGFYMYQDMLESYYIVRSMKDVAEFIRMIREGEDPLKEKRMALYEKAFFIPEGCTVGEYIMKQVAVDLKNECMEMGKNLLKSEELILSGPADHTALEVEEVAQDRPMDLSKFPLFSILVLCYKNEKLLYGMLDSIFAQDYPRIQLIVSDDGSEDFDVERVQRYIDTHWRSNIEQVVVRKNETNMGTVRHIDSALSHVKGEYLVFTAADDRFNGADAISKYVEQFLDNPEKVWIVARCKMTSADYKKTVYTTPTAEDEAYFRKGDARLLFSRWSRRGMAIPCCMAFSMKAFEIVGGIDLDYRYLEDWPMVLKLLRTGHAPLYSENLVAIHSMGGISNSNARYGKELRRQFYNDKYTIFRKEVNPYLSMLTPEDLKAYKTYLKEIMDRHYFFYIDWPDTSTKERLMLCLKKPIRFWWVFEQRFMREKAKIKKKKLFAYGHAALLASLFFLSFDAGNFANIIFRIIGYLDMIGGLFLLMVSVAAKPLEKLFNKKAKLRSKLVN